MKTKFGMRMDGDFDSRIFLYRMYNMPSKITQAEIDETEKRFPPVDLDNEIVIGTLTDTWLKQLFVLTIVEGTFTLQKHMIDDLLKTPEMSKRYMKKAGAHLRNMSVIVGVFYHFLDIYFGQTFTNKKLLIRKGWQITIEKPK